MKSLFAWLTDYEDPRSPASRMRARRARRIAELVDECNTATGRCHILDLGGTARYWRVLPVEFLRSRNVRITLLNLQAETVDGDPDLFESVAGDACNLSCFASGSFDLVHSNSVIEHVGSWQAMQAMADEMRRVGRAYYLQTPYFWFPIEPHYFGFMLHWLPLSWRVKLAMRMRLGHWPRARSVGEAVIAQQAAQLLDATMLRALFPDAIVHRERWLGLTKSLVAMRSYAPRP